MKKVGIMLLCGLVAAMLVGYVGNADAFPDYPKVIDKVKGLEKIKAEATEAKCNVCHYGKSKKNRNDFGKALSKAGLTKELYDKSREGKEGDAKLDAVAEILNEHVDKVLKDDEGKAFKERIEAGKLPAENPAEVE
jgi:hypothetical protein